MIKECTKCRNDELECKHEFENDDNGNVLQFDNNVNNDNNSHTDDNIDNDSKAQ